MTTHPNQLQIDDGYYWTKPSDRTTLSIDDGCTWIEPSNLTTNQVNYLWYFELYKLDLPWGYRRDNIDIAPEEYDEMTARRATLAHICADYQICIDIPRAKVRAPEPTWVRDHQDGNMIDTWLCNWPDDVIDKLFDKYYDDDLFGRLTSGQQMRIWEATSLADPGTQKRTYLEFLSRFISIEIDPEMDTEFGIIEILGLRGISLS